MARKLAYLLATAAGMFGMVAGASATTCTTDSCTILNPYATPTTVVEAAQTGSGAVDSTFFSGSNWGPNVGGMPGSGDYTTTSLNVTYANTTVSKGVQQGMVTLTFDTAFAQTGGTQTLNSQGATVYAADIFIESGSALSGALTSTFNYGISLGKTQAADGGLAPGLYYNSSGLQYSTSNNIWSGSTESSVNKTFNGYYGGGFAAESKESSSEASPTVLTSSTSDVASPVSGITVCTSDTTGCTASDGFSTTGDGGFGTLTVTLAGSLSQLEGIFSDFDIFWGTGDCSNAPIWGNISDLFPSTSVPEPSSLLLLTSAAVAFEMIRRRKRRGPATA